MSECVNADYNPVVYVEVGHVGADQKADKRKAVIGCLGRSCVSIMTECV